MTVKNTISKQALFSEASLRSLVLGLVLLLQNIAMTSSGFAQVPDGVSIPEGYSFQQIICNPLAGDDGSSSTVACGDCAPCAAHIYLVPDTANRLPIPLAAATFTFSITEIDVVEHYGFFRFSRAPPRA